MIRRAIRPLTGDCPVSVRVRPAILIEEVIYEETETNQASVIVLRQDQMPLWRRPLSLLVGNEPAIATPIRDHIDAEIKVVE